MGTGSVRFSANFLAGPVGGGGASAAVTLNAMIEDAKKPAPPRSHPSDRGNFMRRTKRAFTVDDNPIRVRPIPLYPRAGQKSDAGEPFSGWRISVCVYSNGRDWLTAAKSEWSSHLRADVVEEGVEIAELTAGFGESVGDGGEAGEFGVDELVDHRDGGALVDFAGGLLAYYEDLDLEGLFSITSR
jgi:hypothetical protein